MRKIGNVVNKYDPEMDTLWYCMKRMLNGELCHCYYISMDDINYVNYGNIYYSATYISVVEAIKIMIG